MVREESTQADGKAKGPLVSFSLVPPSESKKKKGESGKEMDIAIGSARYRWGKKARFRRGGVGGCRVWVDKKKTDRECEKEALPSRATRWQV